MFHTALPRGQGPASADLPPTLQPRAITASAPASDHFLAATIAGLIYAALGASAVALSSLAPHRMLAPAHPPADWRPIILDSAPATLHAAFHPISAGSGGAASAAAPATRLPAPEEDPGSAAAGLPAEDHHRDSMGPGLGGTESPTPQGGPAGPSPGSAVHDSTSVGLAVLRQVDPAYPDFARRARIQGIVVLQMTVDELGQPTRVQVLEGHPVFHEAAVQAARQWRFEPARMDGRPVGASFRLTLKFTLR